MSTLKATLAEKIPAMREEVKKLVRVGDVVTRERNIIGIGNVLNGKSFDDRIGVFIMIEGELLNDSPVPMVPSMSDIHVREGPVRSPSSSSIPDPTK